MAPREEYRLIAAFQAIQGYVFHGAFVGALVAVLNVAPRTPPLRRTVKFQFSR